MEHWTMQHQTAAVEMCIKTESVTATQHGVRQQSQSCDAPGHNSLLLWVSKRHQEGSVMDSKPKGCPLLVHTPDNVEQVREAAL
jgi:hypothetical protein